MRIGANTYPFLWSSSLEDSFTELSQMGIRHVEIIASAPHLLPNGLSNEDRKRIYQAAQSQNIRLIALNPPGLDINLASVNPDMRAYTVDLYKQLIVLADEWEIPFIVMPPGKLHPLLPPDFEWVWNHCKPGFEELTEFAERHHVTLLIENIPSLFLQTAEEIGWALNEIRSPNLAAIYDVANGFMVEDPAEGIRQLSDRIELVHLSDTTRQKWEHNVIGRGAVDFKSVYEALLDIRYDGLCMLEIINHDAKFGLTESLKNLQNSGWNRNG